MVNISLPSVVLGVCSRGVVVIMAVLDMVTLGTLYNNTRIMNSSRLLQRVLFSSRDAPVLVQGLASVKVVAISAGESHSAAITDKGALYTWGRGNYGRLGHG